MKHFIHFKRANLFFKNDILSWLEQPHVKEFWDNSTEHKQDILIFIADRKEASPYLNGIFDYWIGLIDSEPFSLIMTSNVLPTEDIPKEWLPHLSKTGKTISLDFMIGNEKFLGKGLAAKTLIEFMKFFKEVVEPQTDIFIIDPALNNPKAIRTYEKAGFQIVAEFIRNNVSHLLMIMKAIT